jgi:hypothetical protein
VASVVFGPSILTAYTAESLLCALSGLEPVDGTYTAKQPFQRGDLRLKSGRRVSWLANGNSSLLLIEGAREQLYRLRPGFRSFFSIAPERPVVSASGPIGIWVRIENCTPKPISLITFQGDSLLAHYRLVLMAVRLEKGRWAPVPRSRPYLPAKTAHAHAWKTLRPGEYWTAKVDLRTWLDRSLPGGGLRPGRYQIVAGLETSNVAVHPHAADFVRMTSGLDARTEIVVK